MHTTHVQVGSDTPKINASVDQFCKLLRPHRQFDQGGRVRGDGEPVRSVRHAWQRLAMTTTPTATGFGAFGEVDFGPSRGADGAARCIQRNSLSAVGALMLGHATSRITESDHISRQGILPRAIDHMPHPEPFNEIG